MNKNNLSRTVTKAAHKIKDTFQKMCEPWFLPSAHLKNSIIKNDASVHSVCMTSSPHINIICNNSDHKWSTWSLIFEFFFKYWRKTLYSVESRNIRLRRRRTNRTERTEEVLLWLTLANPMIQKAATVQCQPLRGSNIRRRQWHGSQAQTQRLTGKYAHSDTHCSFTERKANLNNSCKNLVFKVFQP